MRFCLRAKAQYLLGSRAVSQGIIIKQNRAIDLSYSADIFTVS